MRKPANMLFLALLIAAFGSTLVYRYLNAQHEELEAAREAALRSTASVDVVVAARNIDIGTRLAAGDVTVVAWPAETSPEGAIHTPELVVGKMARHHFVRFQPISHENLTDHRSGILPMLIDTGMRAMSVRVDKKTGVSGFITPNSYVDVYATGMVADGSGREQRSKLILQNVKVMAIGKSIEMENDEPIEVPTVTLMVLPDDGEKLTLASQQRPVRLALRHYEDAESVVTTGMSMNQLLAKGNGPAPAVVRVARPPAPPSMELLLGETSVRVQY